MSNDITALSNEGIELSIEVREVSREEEEDEVSRAGCFILNFLSSNISYGTF